MSFSKDHIYANGQYHSLYSILDKFILGKKYWTCRHEYTFKKSVFDGRNHYLYFERCGYTSGDLPCEKIIDIASNIDLVELLVKSANKRIATTEDSSLRAFTEDEALEMMFIKIFYAELGK